MCLYRFFTPSLPYGQSSRIKLQNTVMRKKIAPPRQLQMLASFELSVAILVNIL